jgi:hypothetical protein
MIRLGKGLLAALALLAGILPIAAGAAQAPRIEVTQAKFRIDLGDGRVVAGADLVGVILHLRDGAGRPLEIRIDSVTSPSEQPASGIELYGLSRRDAQGAWSPLCKPGADGRALGFPLPATAPSDDDVAADGGGFSIACTAGARGKCVMLGYRPWAAAANGESLRPHFEACVRMMRADYCGDGRSYTRPGIRIDMWDSAGIQAAQADMPFEAAWGPNGAVCLTKVRVPALSSLADVLAACPRLASLPSSTCDSRSPRPGNGALIWNASPAP